MASDDDKTDAAHPHFRRDMHPGDGVTRSTGRMEYFADAVFAIAFTLPISEIQLPEAGPGYAARLIELWPSYFGYGLAALVIGVYWIHHHFSGAIYITTGHRFLLATALFLAVIGFIGFPTRAFAEHVQDPAARETGARFYVWALAAAAIAWWVKWHAGRTGGHIDPRLDPAYIAHLSRKYGITALLMAAAAGLALVHWGIALALAAGATLYYLLPPETPQYMTTAPETGED